MLLVTSLRACQHFVCLIYFNKLESNRGAMLLIWKVSWNDLLSLIKNIVCQCRQYWRACHFNSDSRQSRQWCFKLAFVLTKYYNEHHQWKFAWNKIKISLLCSATFKRLIFLKRERAERKFLPSVFRWILLSLCTQWNDQFRCLGESSCTATTVISENIWLVSKIKTTTALLLIYRITKAFNGIT